MKLENWSVNKKEITGVSTIKFKDAAWMSTSLGDDPVATWKSNIKWCSGNNQFKDLNRIDGMPTEFEWNVFPGITTLGLLEKIQSLMRDLQCQPEHFQRQDHLHVNVQRH